MSIQNANTGAGHYDVVRTLIDDIFFTNYDYQELGNGEIVDATSNLVFRQESSDKAQEYLENFRGTGAWTDRTAEGDVAVSDPEFDQAKVFKNSAWANSLRISKHWFDDDQHMTYEKLVRDMARRARTTRDKNAFAAYRDAFAGATFTTGGALPVISDSHIRVGETVADVDNKLTAVLTETSLWTAMQMLVEQKAQDGELGGHVGRVLLVPPALLKTAIEITDSELRSGTGNNDLNVYSAKFGIQVVSSPFVGAVASGSDTAWFLLSENHSMYRFTRQGVVTDLVDYKYRDDNHYVYKGEFRENVGPLSYEGIVGSDGTV